VDRRAILNRLLNQIWVYVQMDFYFENDQRLELGGIAQKLDGNVQAIHLVKKHTKA